MRKDFQLLTLFMLTVFFSSVSFAKGRAVTCDEYYSGKSLERKASRFKGAINHAAKKHGVNRDFIKAVIAVETCFRPNARGLLGEKGLMQLMPATARKMGVKNGYNSWQNIDGGTRYLKYLLRRFNGNKHYAAAAYNGGPGAVSRTKGPRFAQVRKYSRHVMRAYHKMNGVKDVSSKKSLRKRKVKTYRVKKGQTLSTIARINNISVKRLKKINNLSSSHLKAGQKLRLSTIRKANINNTQTSKEALVKAAKRGKKSHRVKENQTLYSIAKKSGLSVQRLKKLNKLKSSTIKVGQRLRLK